MAKPNFDLLKKSVADRDTRIANDQQRAMKEEVKNLATVLNNAGINFRDDEIVVRLHSGNVYAHLPLEDGTYLELGWWQGQGIILKRRRIEDTDHHPVIGAVAVLNSMLGLSSGSNDMTDFRADVYEKLFKSKEG